MHRRHSARCVLPLALLLAACSVQPPARAPAPATGEMLARIHAAGAADDSVLEVVPLRTPGVQALQDAVEAALVEGRPGEASRLLEQARALEPGSPPLLQLAAETELLRGHWQPAEWLARESWRVGPRLGPLCARNWQTVIEIRSLRGDAAAVADAGTHLARCRVPEVPRY